MASAPRPPRLPAEQTGPSSVRRIAVLVSGLLLCLVAANVAASMWLREHGTNLGYRMVKAKYDLLESLEGSEPVDWLILGDSSGAHGIVPEVWSEELGGTTVNLAILANLLAVNDAWMLGEYIERVGVPRNVVLVHAHDVWRRGYNSALIGQIPRTWGFWNRRLPHVRMAADHTRKVAVSRFLPLLGEAETLRKHIRHLGPDRELHFQITESGWIPGQPHSRSRLSRDAEYTKERLAKEPKFTMSGHNKRALEVLGRMSEKHDFRLFVTHAPMLDTVARRADFRRYVADGDTRIRSVTEDYPQVHVMGDLVRMPFEDLEAYADHTTPEAAPRYTAQQAANLKRFIANEWVDGPPDGLPPVPPPSTAVALSRPSDDDTVSIVFGGDTSFARGIDATIRATGGRPGVVFDRLKPIFDEADLTFLNLECVLSDSAAQAAGKRWNIRASVANGKALVDGGVDIVSVANNHTRDFGEQGFRSTLNTLHELGVAYTGVQYGRTGRQLPTVAQVGEQTFGFLAYTDITKWKAVPEGHREDYWPKPANYDVEEILADIQAAAPTVDHLIVSVHWGEEYSMVVEDFQREAAHAFVDAGAELIIGHHPHVPRKVERYGDGLIAYSLGDLLFDKATPFKSVRNRRRFLLKVDWTSGQRSDFSLLPIHSLDDHLPYPMPELDVASWIDTPLETPWRATDHLASARVARTTGSRSRACDQWTTKGLPNRNNGYLRWLRPRWACAGEDEAPWYTVAVSGDRSDAVFRKGIWAHPHPQGDLTIEFGAVPLGATLGGFVGVPDWPLALAGNGSIEPISFVVEIDGKVVHRESVPFTPGWNSFSIDTAARASEPAQVTVRVSGGPAKETGLTFDLAVDAEL